MTETDVEDHQDHTVETAREAAERGELDSWVARFLASPGSDNAVLAEALTGGARTWTGPARIPIDQLNRLAGPPGEPVLEAVPEDFWRDDVEELALLIEEGFEPAPVIVTLRDDQYVLEDGNHRVEALRRAGVQEAWAIVGVEPPHDA